MHRRASRLAVLAVVAAAASLTGSGLPTDVAERAADPVMTQQMQDFADLETHAARLSKKGTPDYDAAVYYSILRQGLAVLSGRPQEDSQPQEEDGRPQEEDGRPQQNGRRSGGEPQQTTKIQDLKPDVDPDLDVQKEVQERLDEVVRQGLNGARIVGGSMVQALNFMPTVAIADMSNETGCSGTVISVDGTGGWVLTAAHCICEFRLYPGGNGEAIIRFGNPRLGVSTKWRDLDKSRTRLYAPGFCERYWSNSRNICDVDLAVLRYKATEPPYADFAPAKFPNATTAAQDLAFTTELVGFGDTDVANSTRTNGVRSLMLKPSTGKKSALVPSIGRCSSNMPQCTASTHGCVAEDFEVIIADAYRSADTCSGDSGGSVYNARSAESKRRLLAVTSRAIDSTGKCGPGGIYVKAFSPPVIKWLRDDLHISISVDP